jgi:hypothetical protein
MKYIVTWLIVSVVLGIVIGNMVAKDEPGARITRSDKLNKIAYVELHPMLISGSDGACQTAGIVILDILEHLPDEWQVHITNEWVPSRYNPIDKKWAKTLAQGY